MAKKDSALRKRQQIAKANRMMFLWVMGVSVIVGAAGVVSVFLIQKAEFNGDIIAKKTVTAEILEENNKNIASLEDNVRLLEVNEALEASKATAEEKALQVILDALPANVNEAALGSSLQRVLLDVDGVEVESLRVGDNSGSVTDLGTPATPFNFVVTVPGNDKLETFRTLFEKLESSIRAIDIQDISVEMKGRKVEVIVNAVAYYQPKVEVKLKYETVAP